MVLLLFQQIYHPISMWKLSLMRNVGSNMAPTSSHSLGCLSSLESTKDGSAAVLMYQSMSVILHLGKSTTSGILGVESLQPPLDLSSGFICFLLLHWFPSFAKFLAGHVTGQFRFLILVTLGWMEASWLPTVFNMLTDISHQCHIAEHLVVDVWRAECSRVSHHCILPFGCTGMCVV